MIYDLHAHSSASDGILSPAALVSRAKARGVSQIALTDHDTLDGIAEAREASERVNIGFVPGIEFSTQWRNQGIHIVGLNVDDTHEGLLGVVAQQRQTRIDRASLIAERLAEKGVNGALAGAQKYAGGEVVGRPHFAQFLIEQGFAKDMSSAFREFLGKGRAGDVPNLWLSLECVTQAIVAAGGAAVIAHPCKYRLTRTRLGALIDEFKTYGGQGLEVISGQQKLNDTQNMALLAKQKGLHSSCGSDFHSPDQAWQELGVCGQLPKNCQPIWQLWQ